jgi:hypothetical protein
MTHLLSTVDDWTDDGTERLAAQVAAMAERAQSVVTSAPLLAEGPARAPRAVRSSRPSRPRVTLALTLDDYRRDHPADESLRFGRGARRRPTYVVGPVVGDFGRIAADPLKPVRTTPALPVIVSSRKRG